MTATTSTEPALLILCEPHDASALWAADGLERRIGNRVELVTGSILANALSWEHRIRGDVAEVDITLADGRHISSDQARPVLNRLRFVPTDRLARVGGDDEDYAVQEFQALFLSWLWALPGTMVNRPSPQFLAGHWRQPAAWAVLAARAGFSTVPYRQSSDDPVARPAVPWTRGAQAERGLSVAAFVACGQVVAAHSVPDTIVQACRRLAELTGDDLVGIEIAPRDDGGWEFVTATPVPDLRAGGDALLDLLASTLGAPP